MDIQSKAEQTGRARDPEFLEALGHPYMALKEMQRCGSVVSMAWSRDRQGWDGRLLCDLGELPTRC